MVTSRGGKISRTHYASLLGCNKSSLKRFDDVFADYERKLGIETGPMRYFFEMQMWIAAQYQARTLKFREGKVDRTAFAKEFGLYAGCVADYPRIRELVEKFDKLASEESYRLAERADEFERMLLAFTKPLVLNKDRITINRVVLARICNFPRSRFLRKPFVDALTEKQNSIRKIAEESRIDPYIHGRIFPFGQLQPNWSTLFLEKIGVRFRQGVSGFASVSVRKPYSELVNALSWIGSADISHCRKVTLETKLNNRVVSADDWEDALHAYRDHLVSQIARHAVTEIAVDDRLAALRTSVEILTSGGLLPAISVPLRGIKHASRLGGHLRSVAEASSSRDLNEQDYVSFARQFYVDTFKSLQLDTAGGEREDFIQNIASDLNAYPELPSSPSSALLLVLTNRLQTLKIRATEILDESIKSYERGRYLLTISDIDCQRFESDYWGNNLSNKERIGLVKRLFPNSGNSTHSESERGLANLLAMIEYRHAGVAPRRELKEGGGEGNFFANLYLHYGGLRTIGPMLNPEPSAVGAALTLYLIDSGANVAVGRTLDRECAEVSDLDRHHRVTGNKSRAKGKPIIVDIPDDSQSLRAIKWLLFAGEKLQTSMEIDSDRLFLMRIGGRVQLMTPHWYLSWFKSFASGTTGLPTINLVPSMIRPSVLLHAALSNDGRLATGMAIGQHGQTVTQGYQQKWPTKLLYDENIRRFHTALETLVLAGIEDTATRLGISAEQFAARLGGLRPTGLGTFCRDKRGRTEERNGTCSTMDCWNECPHLLVVAEEEAIAALQLWQESLRSAQPEWERDRPERWDEVWLPWLCLTDVVEEKMARGPLVKIWSAARERASHISSQLGYVAPKPW